MWILRGHSDSVYNLSLLAIQHATEMVLVALVSSLWICLGVQAGWVPRFLFIWQLLLLVLLPGEQLEPSICSKEGSLLVWLTTSPSCKCFPVCRQKGVASGRGCFPLCHLMATAPATSGSSVELTGESKVGECKQISRDSFFFFT